MRDLLGGLHHPHVAVSFLRPAGGEAKAAVAGDDRGDAILASVGAGRIPEDLGVVVGVGVHVTGRHDPPLRVDPPPRGRRAEVADAGDGPVPHAHIGAEPRETGAVDDDAAGDDQIELAHGLASNDGHAFLHVAHLLCHVPLFAPERRIVKAMMWAIDAGPTARLRRCSGLSQIARTVTLGAAMRDPT